MQSVNYFIFIEELGVVLLGLLIDFNTHLFVLTLDQANILFSSSYLQLFANAK